MATTEENRRTGKVKWFNVVKGYGFIKPNDGEPDVFVHQNVIKMEGFRSLDDDEEVEFETHETEKGVEATTVTGPGNTNCKGSNRRPLPKRRFPRIKCYNCGRFSDHRAAQCPHNTEMQTVPKSPSNNNNNGNIGGNPRTNHNPPGRGDGVNPADTNYSGPPSSAKLCYQCKSNQHLIKDCPNAIQPRTKGSNNNKQHQEKKLVKSEQGKGEPSPVNNNDEIDETPTSTTATPPPKANGFAKTPNSPGNVSTIISTKNNNNHNNALEEPSNKLSLPITNGGGCGDGSTMTDKSSQESFITPKNSEVTLMESLNIHSGTNKSNIDPPKIPSVFKTLISLFKAQDSSGLL